MLDYQPIKNITIYDPYSSNGFFLAKKLASKGCNIHLFTDVRLENLTTSFFSNELENRLTITDLSENCMSNLVHEEFIQHCNYLIVMDSVADSKWFFDKTYDFSYELKITQLKYELSLLARKNNVLIIEYKILHCSFETLSQIISKILDFMYHKVEQRLYLNTLNCDFFVMENSSYIDVLRNITDDLNKETISEEIQKFKISLRDVFRLVFEVLGAEIEFCGKFENEKGVIVDYDMDVSGDSMIYSSKFRLGNTIVKINEQNYNCISAILENKSDREITTELDPYISYNIKKLITDKLDK